MQSSRGLAMEPHLKRLLKKMIVDKLTLIHLVQIIELDTLLISLKYVWREHYFLLLFRRSNMLWILLIFVLFLSPVLALGLC